MNGSDFTTDDARERLDRAARADLASRGDYSVYGWYVVLMGLVVGAYVAITRVIEGGSGSPWVLSGYVVLLAGVTIWQARSTRAVPRGAKRKGLFALLGTVALALIVITALNLIEVEMGLQWWHVLLGGVVTALPSVVTGLAIARGGAR